MESLFLVDSINEYRPGAIQANATDYKRPNTSDRTGCPSDPNNLWHIECMYSCGGTAQKPATTQGVVDWALNRSYNYVVITQGFYDTYKNEVDNYISRGGKVYKLISKSGCSDIDCHCYTIIFEPMVICTPNWQCEIGNTGYEYDGCGNRQPSERCVPCSDVNVVLTIY